MSAPNFAALERLSAVWQVLATHQDLPALQRISWRADAKIHIGLADVAAVDAYGDAFGIPRDGRFGSGWLQNPDGSWTYMRSSDLYLMIANDLAEPLPQQGVETAENSGPERAAAVAT